jgi:antitoxin MazE
MRTNLVRIGNSRGIRIPKPLLEQAGLENTVQLRAGKGRLVIEPARSPRQGWEEAFAAGSDSEAAILGNVTNAFDLDEWTW